MKNFIDKINWRIVLGITFAAIVGLVIAPTDTVWNAVAGISLLLCGAYWMYLLFQND